MTIKHKYREFVKQYEQDLEEFKEDADQYGDPAEKALAKVFKEIACKMEREDFDYAKEIKQELEQI